MKEMFSRFWDYTITHNWAKDILRANFLYILLCLLFLIFHGHWHSIHLNVFFRLLILLNVCQFFKAALDRWWN